MRDNQPKIKRIIKRKKKKKKMTKKSTKRLVSGVFCTSLFTARELELRIVSSRSQTSVKSAVFKTSARPRMTFPFFSRI